MNLIVKRCSILVFFFMVTLSFSATAQAFWGQAKAKDLDQAVTDLVDELVQQGKLEGKNVLIQCQLFF